MAVASHFGRGFLYNEVLYGTPKPGCYVYYRGDCLIKEVTIMLIVNMSLCRVYMITSTRHGTSAVDPSLTIYAIQQSLTESTTSHNVCIINVMGIIV